MKKLFIFILALCGAISISAQEQQDSTETEQPTDSVWVYFYLTKGANGDILLDCGGDSGYYPCNNMVFRDLMHATNCIINKGYELVSFHDKYNIVRRKYAVKDVKWLQKPIYYKK